MEKSIVRPGYKFDHVNCRIIITREFHKKANVFESDEYKSLQKLRKALPNYGRMTPFDENGQLIENEMVAALV